MFICALLCFRSYSSKTTLMTPSTAAASTAWARVPHRRRTASPTRRKKKPTTSTDLRRHHALVFNRSEQLLGIFSFCSRSPSSLNCIHVGLNKTRSALNQFCCYTQSLQTKPNQNTTNILRLGDFSKRIIIPPGHFICLFYSIN